MFTGSSSEAPTLSGSCFRGMAGSPRSVLSADTLQLSPHVHSKDAAVVTVDSQDQTFSHVPSAMDAEFHTPVREVKTGATLLQDSQDMIGGEVEKTPGTGDSRNKSSNFLPPSEVLSSLSAKSAKTSSTANSADVEFLGQKLDEAMDVQKQILLELRGLRTEISAKRLKTSEQS